MFLISACRLFMLYICAKFHEIILNGIKVIERTRFLYGKLQRGITPQKKYRWSNRCLSLHIVWSCFIFLPSFVKLSRTVSKGNNSAKNEGRVTVFNLCTSSGHALYFYQVSRNYLKWYQSYRADTISILKITKGNNSAKNVGEVTVFNLCASPGHALYLCQVS